MLGQIIIDFVNAETTDEACLKHSENIQKLFGFSPDSTKMIKERFPSISSLTPPPRTPIAEIQIPDPYSVDITPCFATLPGVSRVHTLADELGSELSEEIEDLRRQDRETLESLREKLHSGGDDSWVERCLYLIDTGKWRMLYSNYVESIVEKIGDISVGDHIADLERIRTRAQTLALHGRIYRAQYILEGILEDVVKGCQLDEIRGFSDVIEIYNNLPKGKADFDNSSSLIKLPLIDERDYKIHSSTNFYGRLREDLAYCLIEFLIIEKSRKSLGKCDVCLKFFIHPTSKRCSDECRKIAKKKYDTGYKQDDRWEQFVYDVKEKCTKIDDLNKHPELLTRARRFRFGLDGVIERLKEVL
jgi:hypothetical protein